VVLGNVCAGDWLNMAQERFETAGQQDEQGDADQTHLRDWAATDNRLYGGFGVHRQELGAPPRQRMRSSPVDKRTWINI